MRYSKCSSLATLSFLTVSLITTSLGGAFATTVLAATPEVSVQEGKSGDNNGTIAGIAALGLIGLLSSHSGSKGAGNVPATTASAAAASAASATTTTTTTTPAVKTPTTSTSAVSTGAAAAEATALNLLNVDRASNGLKPLKLNSKLTALGENYAQDMINRNFFSHTNPEGQSPFDRMKQAGISYSYAGENIAINSNVTAAEQAFMNSAGHKANILSTNYTDVGIGVRFDANGSAHVVQEFISK